MGTRLQIGVVGSAGADHTETAEATARELGMRIAQRGHVLVFGPELKPPSLATVAARAALDNGGTTLGIALGRATTIFYAMEAASVHVFTEHAGGGGREVVLVNSCDGVIVIGGGVGTLLEISLSYMNCVPIVLLENTGGWAGKLKDSYLDSRKKVELHRSSNVDDAIHYIEETAGNFQPRTLQNH